MSLGALRRFAIILSLASVAATVLGAFLGVVVHEGVRRDLVLGFYLFGVMLVGLAFVLGSRPPVRLRDEREGLPRGVFDRGVRWASREEQDEALNVPALFISVGVCLIVIGALFDRSHKLV